MEATKYPRGDMRDIAEPTYRSLNILTGLRTYLRYFEATDKTFNLPTTHRCDRKLDVHTTYKSLHLNNRQNLKYKQQNTGYICFYSSQGILIQNRLSIMIVKFPIKFPVQVLHSYPPVGAVMYSLYIRYNHSYALII